MDTVTIARSIQIGRYANVAAFALVVVDWAGTFQREIELVWRPKWNVGSLLFFTLRYSTICEFGIIMFMQFGPNIPFDKCKEIQLASSVVCVLGMMMSQIILSLRTYALSGNNRLVSTALSLAITASIIVQTVGMVTIDKSIKFGELPGIPLIGCFILEAPNTAGTGFSTVLGVETLIFIITMWTALVRKSFLESPSRLAYILYRDSLIFYVYVFVMALANVIVIFTAPGPLMGLLMVPQHAMHCIAGTRVVLNVRGGVTPDQHSLTKEIEELTTFDANLKFAQSRGTKSQHSMLDMTVYEQESGSSLEKPGLGDKIQA